MRPMARVPVEPLVALVARLEDASPKSHQQAAARGRLVTDVRVAEAVGVDSTQIARWRAEGGIPWVSADRLAVALNRHPLEVWPDWPGHSPDRSGAVPARPSRCTTPTQEQP